MKTTLLILLGLSALAVVRATSAQTQSFDTAPAWVTIKDVDVLMAEMQRRLAQNRLIDPPDDSALDILRSLRDQETNRAEIQELTRDLFDRMLRNGRAAMRARAYERSSQFLWAAREAGAIFKDPALEQAESELSTARKEHPAPKILYCGAPNTVAKGGH